MKKKIISIILTSAMVFSALCGCGSNQDQSTADGNAAGQASSDDKIVLSVSVMANYQLVRKSKQRLLISMKKKRKSLKMPLTDLKQHILTVRWMPAIHREVHGENIVISF